MSDAHKLKECIETYRKAHKELDKKLSKIEANTRQVRQEQKEQ